MARSYREMKTYFGKIMIGHYPIALYLDPEQEDHGYFDDTGEALEITLKSPNCHTLFHECLHALSCLYGIGLGERQVKCLEQGIINLVRDNLGISRAITQGFFTFKPSVDDPVD